MITSVTNDRCYSFYGKKSDKKPIKNVSNGSVFHEIDTGIIYYFDEEHKKWIPQKHGK